MIKKNLFAIFLFFLTLFYLPGDSLTDTIDKTKKDFEVIKKTGDDAKDKLEELESELLKAKKVAASLTDDKARKKVLDHIKTCEKKVTSTLNVFKNFSTYAGYTSNAIEAAVYMDKIRNLDHTDLKTNLGTLATLMTDYGGKVPILGAAIKAYGEITTGMIKAVDKVGRTIRDMDKGSIRFADDIRHKKMKEQFGSAADYYVPTGCSYIFLAEDDIAYGYYIWDEDALKWYHFDSDTDVVGIFQDNLTYGRRIGPMRLKLMCEKWYVIKRLKETGKAVFDKLADWKERPLGPGSVYWEVNEKHNSRLFREMMNPELFILKYTYNPSFKAWAAQVLRDFRDGLVQQNPNQKAVKELKDLIYHRDLKIPPEKPIIIEGIELDPASDLARDLRWRDELIAKGDKLEDERSNIKGFKINKAYVDTETGDAVIEFEAVVTHYHDTYNDYDRRQLLWIYRDGRCLNYGASVVEETGRKEILKDSDPADPRYKLIDKRKYVFRNSRPLGAAFSHLYTVSFNGISQFGNRRAVVKKRDVVISSKGYSFDPETAALSIASAFTGGFQMNRSDLSLFEVKGGKDLVRQAKKGASEALSEEEQKEAEVEKSALDFCRALQREKTLKMEKLTKIGDPALLRETLEKEIRNVDSKESPLKQGADLFRNRLLKEAAREAQYREAPAVKNLSTVESVYNALSVLSGETPSPSKSRFKDSSFMKEVFDASGNPGAAEKLKKTRSKLPGELTKKTYEIIESQLDKKVSSLNGAGIDRQMEEKAPESQKVIETALKKVGHLSRNNKKIAAKLKGYKPASEDSAIPPASTLSLKSLKEALLRAGSSDGDVSVTPGPEGNAIVNRIHKLYGHYEGRKLIPYKNEDGHEKNLEPFDYILTLTAEGRRIFIPYDVEGNNFSMVFVQVDEKGFLVNPFTGFLYGVYDI